MDSLTLQLLYDRILKIEAGFVDYSEINTSNSNIEYRLTEVEKLAGRIKAIEDKLFKLEIRINGKIDKNDE